MKFIARKPARQSGAIILTLALATISHAAALQPTSVVATVDGKTILYSEIAFSDATTIKLRNFSLPPEKKAKTLAPKDLETARHKFESTNLSNLIHRIVIPNMVSEYRIKVSDAEIQKQVKLQLNGQSIEAVTKQIRDHYALILMALESVYSGQETEASAYEKYMKKTVGSLDLWEDYLVTYKTPERRLELKAASETSVESMRKSYEIAARNGIESKKLYSKVNEMIAATDPQFKKALPAAKGFQENPSPSTKYVWTKQRDWWQKIYKKRVKVSAEEFDDIYAQL